MTFAAQPICEACWIEREGEWEQVPGAGTGTKRLVSVRVPTVLKSASLELCAYCGGPTIMGAYTRADSASVPFPRIEQ